MAKKQTRYKGPPPNRVTCPVCGGAGYFGGVQTLRDRMNSRTTAADLDELKCKACDGTGKVNEEKSSANVDHR